jgi:hypothetical protein
MKQNISLGLELPQIAGAQFEALGLRLPEGLAFEQWADIGKTLCRSDQVMKWWLGDWAAFGSRKYGQLKEFAEINGLNYGTLRNLAWVSEKVELSRRRDNVEWSKHAEVAALEPREQQKWLAKAEKEELPVVEIRRQIRQSQGESNALASDGPVLKFASKACDDLVNWIRSQPEDFWNEERRTAWRERLRPIVEFWEKL